LEAPLASDADSVGSLLSSVSVMLAAFGVFYTAQRDGMEAAINDDSLPDAAEEIRSRCAEVSRYRNVAAALTIAALAVWILLLPEVAARVGEAFDAKLDPGEYSAPDAIFVVAANAWLLLAIYIGGRWRALWKRRQSLDRHLRNREGRRSRPT
jgi:hypothetical protein